MVDPTLDNKSRCPWAKNAISIAYHDHEWGVSVTDERKLFEMLILEGAQAGLRWDLILAKREGYRRAFHNFDARRVAAMTDSELNLLRTNPDIIRNRLKIFSARKNAHAFLEIQNEFKTFYNYLLNFVDGKPIINRFTSMQQVPASTPISDALAKDLRQRKMSFVGSTIMYAYLQSVGLVNDHLTSCWRFPLCP